MPLAELPLSQAKAGSPSSSPESQADIVGPAASLPFGTKLEELLLAPGPDSLYPRPLPRGTRQTSRDRSAHFGLVPGL